MQGVFIDDEHTKSGQSSKIEEFTFLVVDDFSASAQNSLFTAPRTKPGIAFISSALIPGSGQAINGKWGRAIAYFLVDVAGILYYVDRNNMAKRNERAYEAYANKNWSVVAYAEWLVEYSRANGIKNGYNEPGGLQERLIGRSPSWENTTKDWHNDLLQEIRNVEVKTPFIFNEPEGCTPPSCREGSVFSHVLQDYGSQQYYELMSKYYQFQSGWRDFHKDRTAAGANHVYRYSWSSSMITANFTEGRDRAFEFNDNYRKAGNIVKLLVVNHIVSAFDAYVTVKLKNSRLEPNANLLSAETFSIIWHF